MYGVIQAVVLFLIVAPQANAWACSRAQVADNLCIQTSHVQPAEHTPSDETSLLQKNTHPILNESPERHLEASPHGDVTHDKVSSFWSQPVVLGLVLGLILIGPDHLGTLIALSTLTSGFDSFKVGFSWGLGHSLGMIFICPMFFLVREVAAKRFHASIDVDQWEFYGDYFIGASMVVVAAYFFVYESSYVTKQQDGTFKALGCSCHISPPTEAGAGDVLSEDQAQVCMPCGPAAVSYDHGKQPWSASDRKAFLQEEAQDAQGSGPEALLKTSQSDACEDKEVVNNRATSAFCCPGFLNLRDVQSCAIGALQGLCCPMGLTGIAFLGHMSISASPLKLGLFVVVLVLSSAFGSGAITFIWGELTTKGSGTCLSPQVVYRVSCIMTLLLGLGWILANATGVLHDLNYSEEMINRRMVALQSSP